MVTERNGVIKTFTINSSDQISEADSLEHHSGTSATTGNSEDNSLVRVDSDIFALAYDNGYGGNDGFISTFTIDSDGTITGLSTANGGDNLEHDTSSSKNRSLVKVDSNTVALAYGGTDNVGFISTFTIGDKDDLILINKNINTSLSESVSLTDDTAAGISVTIPLSETIGLADSISKTKEIVIPLGETLQVSDSVSIGKTVTQSLTETISLEDKVSKAVEEKLSESVSLTDSSSAFKSRIVSLSESISFTDSSGKEIVTNLSESIALTEGITKKVTVDLSESVQLIDF